MDTKLFMSCRVLYTELFVVVLFVRGKIVYMSMVLVESLVRELSVMERVARHRVVHGVAHHNGMCTYVSSMDLIIIVIKLDQMSMMIIYERREKKAIDLILIVQKYIFTWPKN